MLHRWLVLLALAAAPAAAEPVPYVFDMSHSRLFFDYNHQGYSLMIGRFTRFGGELVYDAEHPEASRLDIEIDPASVDVFDAALNERLKGKDFFDVADFPKMHFVSESVSAVGDDRLRVDGRLTMLGITRPVSFEVVRNKLGVNRQGEMVAGFSAHGRLRRADFGMSFLTPMIAEEVMFRIEIEAWPAERGN